MAACELLARPDLDRIVAKVYFAGKSIAQGMVFLADVDASIPPER